MENNETIHSRVYTSRVCIATFIPKPLATRRPRPFFPTAARVSQTTSVLAPSARLGRFRPDGSKTWKGRVLYTCDHEIDTQYYKRHLYPAPMYDVIQSNIRMCAGNTRIRIVPVFSRIVVWRQ